MELLLLALLALGIATAAQSDLHKKLEIIEPERGYAVAFLWKKEALSEEQIEKIRSCCTLDEDLVAVLQRATLCRPFPIQQAEIVWAPVRSRAGHLGEDEVWIAILLDPKEKIDPEDLWPSLRKAACAVVPLQLRFGAIGGAGMMGTA